MVSREALATVGRTLTLAALLPALSWPAMSAVLADGFFPQAPTGGVSAVPHAGRLLPNLSYLRERGASDGLLQEGGSLRDTDGHGSGRISLLSSQLRAAGRPDPSDGRYPGAPDANSAAWDTQEGDRGTSLAGSGRAERVGGGPDGKGVDQTSVSAEEGGDHVDPACWDNYRHVSHVEAALRKRGTSLAAELQRCPPASRACVLKGLVQSLPGEALCAPLERSPGDLEGPMHGAAPAPWTLLVDGALRYGCEAAETARDVHVKYQAVCLIEACLARICTFLEVRMSSPPSPPFPHLPLLLRPFGYGQFGRKSAATLLRPHELALVDRVCNECTLDYECKTL